MPRNMAAGPLDRRIRIQEATETRDAAGDVILTWPEIDEGTKVWASKKDGRPQEMEGSQQILRQIDTTFTVRWSAFTSAVGPETHRILYGKPGNVRIYEIVGLAETNSRADGVAFYCSSRPDQRGTREPVDKET